MHSKALIEPVAYLVSKETTNSLPYSIQHLPSSLNISMGDHIFELERKISDLNHLYKMS